MPKPRGIIVRGEWYPSQAAAARALGVSRQAVHVWARIDRGFCARCASPLDTQIFCRRCADYVNQKVQAGRAKKKKKAASQQGRQAGDLS